MIAEMMYHAFFDFIREIVFQVGNLRTSGLEKLQGITNYSDTICCRKTPVGTPAL